MVLWLFVLLMLQYFFLFVIFYVACSVGLLHFLTFQSLLCLFFTPRVNYMFLLCIIALKCVYNFLKEVWLKFVTRRFTLFKTQFGSFRYSRKIEISIQFRKTNARAVRVRHGGMRAHQRREWSPAAPVRPCSKLPPRILYQWVLNVINFNVFKCEWKKGILFV